MCDPGLRITPMLSTQMGYDYRLNRHVQMESLSFSLVNIILYKCTFLCSRSDLAIVMTIVVICFLVFLMFGHNVLCAE